MIHGIITLIAAIIHPLLAAAAAAYFIGREVAQAEYRRIGSGKRADMPWWGGLDPKAWTAKSVLDAVVPIAIAAIAWVLL